MNSTSIKTRLIGMNFLEFAVWGAYLISMGGFLASKGMGANIGWFYSIQGVVSIFMPAIVGILADRFVQAQRMLAICHVIAALSMVGVGIIGSQAEFSFWEIFPVYTLSVAAYMPTLALSNSVSYNALEKYNLDTVKAFPPIRIFGTIGFIDVGCRLFGMAAWTRTVLCFCRLGHRFGTLCADSPSMSHSSAQYRRTKRHC